MAKSNHQLILILNKKKIQKSQLFPFGKQHTYIAYLHLCSVWDRKTKQTFFYRHIVTSIAFQTQEFVNLIKQTYMQIAEIKQLNSFKKLILKF